MVAVGAWEPEGAFALHFEVPIEDEAEIAPKLAALRATHISLQD
jgi:hypothetical protein